MLETSATRRSTRRATEGHTGTRTSLHSAPPSGCLPEPQTAVRLLTDHTAGPAKPQSIPGSQRTACGPQPRPAQALLASRSAVHHHLLKPGRYRPAVAPDSGLSGQRTEGDHHHLADRQPLDLQPHRRDPAVWHPAVWKHIASMVMPEVKTLHPEWDSVPCQVKRTAVRDACRAMSNVKTFNLELKSHQARARE